MMVTLTPEVFQSCLRFFFALCKRKPATFAECCKTEILCREIATFPLNCCWPGQRGMQGFLNTLTLLIHQYGAREKMLEQQSVKQQGSNAQGKRIGWRSALAGGLPLLFGFLLLGDLAWSFKERAMPDLFKFQLARFSQDAVLLNLLCGAIPALIVMLVGPLVGAWSDRTRSRLGRRIPFLLVSAPLVSASMLALAYSASIGAALWQWCGAPAGQREFYVLLCMCTSWTVYEVFTIISNGLFLALVNDTVPQWIIGRFFAMFRIVSLGVGVVFFYFVFNNELPNQVQNVMVAIAVAYLLGFWCLCLGVKETAFATPAPAPALPQPAVAAEVDRPRGYYAMLFFTLAIASICVLPVNINAYNGAVQFGVDQRDYGRAVAIAYSISIGLAMPVGWLADRFHPLRVGYVGLALYAGAMLAAWLLVAGRLSYLIWLVVHAVLAGVFLTGTAALLPVMLPRARFSSLAALAASVSSLLTVFFTVGIGALLDASGRDYRLMFLAGGVLASVATLCWYILLWMERRRRRPGQPSPRSPA